MGHILSLLKNKSFNEVTFTGGEPLLKKDLVLYAITNAYKLGFKVNLNTNGTLLNQFTLNIIKKLKNISLYLSANNNTNINNLKKIRESVHTCLIYVITKNNFQDLKRISEASHAQSIKLIIQPAYVRKGYKYYHKLSLRTLKESKWKLLERFLIQWGRENNKKEYINLILGFYNRTRTRKPKKCHMGTSDIVINSDGSVYPCFHRQDMYAGNILTDPFDRIKENIKRFAKKTRKAQCYNEHCISLFY